MLESKNNRNEYEKKFWRLGRSGQDLADPSLACLELVLGDGLFVGVLAFQSMYNRHDYFDGRYERHC